MEIITILVDEDEQGQPRVQVVSSAGLADSDALSACRRAVNVFTAQVVQAEIERRVAEAMEDGGEDDGSAD